MQANETRGENVATNSYGIFPGGTSQALAKKVDSCTRCFFDLFASPQPSPGGEGAKPPDTIVAFDSLNFSKDPMINVPALYPGISKILGFISLFTSTLFTLDDMEKKN